MEVVSISRLRSAIAESYENREGKIDDILVLSFVCGNGLMPEIATFGQLANAYQRMVEGTKLNRLFLKELLGQMLSAFVHDGDETVQHTELSEHDLRSVTWMLQYYLCDCSSWRFVYSSFHRQSFPALIAVVDTFDEIFEPDESLSKLAMLLIQNTPLPRADLPSECPLFRNSPETARYFKCDTAFLQFPLNIYFDFCDREIRVIIASHTCTWTYHVRASLSRRVIRHLLFPWITLSHSCRINI
jgi:hypothetical protein